MVIETMKGIAVTSRMMTIVGIEVGRSRDRHE